MTGLSVATWNIHKGIGRDRRRDLDRTAAVIGEIAPDIMALQEADTRFFGRKGLLDLDALGREHGLVAVALPGGSPAHGWHGNVLLLREAEVDAVHRVDLPGLEPRGALIADLHHKGQPLRIIGTHLGLLPASRAAQTRHLLALLAAMDKRPALLMGDLNEWRAPGSAAFRHLATHFRDTVALPSYPARYPLAPLDRMMVSGPARLQHGAVHDTSLARRASDHLPVKAQFWLE
ncbi:endonuclease/exonuclease/phosphatase family protein [Yoonia vestfoldensis]|uniref:endonuclease/exonuclease/phosphatase family protein n=1 Tax=Yoonia vestfoldensis TaxID=245188 RepID=UPI0003795779|nr:endonuclease/exonuclease/phosphatase family protein [Yoonia vestfoldensis]